MIKCSKFKFTIASSYVGYVTQAIVNNFRPLLFLTFGRLYGVTVSQITLLVSLNFAVQLLTDLFSVKFIQKIGYRKAVVIAHFCSAAGLVLLAFLPDIIGYAGLITCVCIYAVGGGLIEVLISPIVEACPTENKTANMSLLHSAYCWGSALVVLASTGFFTAFSIDNWRVLSMIWAVIPFLNAFSFMIVPIRTLEEGTHSLSLKSIAGSGVFWVLMLLMLCSGASEIAVSQWASFFAEKGLGVSKTIGDLTGPCMFAVLMGSARVFCAVVGEKVPMEKYLIFSGMLCVVGYAMIALCSNPAVSLVGCCVCGIAVAAMWPGTFTLATKYLPAGGTAMFAFLALAGDTGCSTGPGVVGVVTDVTGNMHTGFSVAMIFPVMLILGIYILKKTNKTGDKI